MREKEIHPTQEDMQAMHAAIYLHRRSLNFYLTQEELIADAYVGLVKALPYPEKDKKNYLIRSIKFHLINVYRSETKSRNKYKLDVSSLDAEIDENGTELKDILCCNFKSQEDIIYEKEVMDIVEKTFSGIKKKHKDALSGDDMFTILMLRMENFNFKDIGYLLDRSESRISQIYNSVIIPILNEIRERLSDAL